MICTDKAGQDLDAIIGYIMTELCNPSAALSLVDEVERHYGLLIDNPYIYGECRQPLLQRSRFRKAVIGGYLMIYRVDDVGKTIYIERFFSDMQDYTDKL